MAALFYFYTNILQMDVKMEASWKEALKNEFTKPYFQQIVTFLKTEKAAGKIIYPPGSLQDPYHGEGQAHGLSFSVQNGIKPPPSLVNIFKEIQSDIGIAMPAQYGNLTRWAEQGVLLLNAALTVRANEPFSHAKFGWAEFTDAVIQKISDEKKGIVFLLWGKFAQDKQVLIDETKHFVLKAAHPSPLSAHAGFMGCKHFSKTNEYLVKQGRQPINWKLMTP